MTSGLSFSASDRIRSGIRFETVAPPLAEAMPRMDVAAFVGFAERGPLHCPVPIADITQFETVFGVTPRLGRTPEGEWLSGHLAGSVRAFFTQGGLRCWVIRVAGPGACSNHVSLPNLFRVRPLAGSILVGPARAQARCEGAWSDSLSVATRQQVRSFTIESIGQIGPGSSSAIHTPSDIVRPGDLVRIVNATGDQQVFFPITTVERAATGGGCILHATDFAGFSKHTISKGNQLTGGWEHSENVNCSTWKDGRAAVVSVDLRVRSYNTSDTRFENRASTEWRVENLGLTALHPRYVGALPTDMEIYQGKADSGEAAKYSNSSWRKSDAWFPLAGMPIGDAGMAREFLIPLGMDGNFGSESSVDPVLSSKLDRDGLAKFDANLFLDASLRDAPVAELLVIANDVRYSAPEPRPLQGIHAVLGWPDSTINDEVTLIAVPDAVQSPWLGQSEPVRFSCEVVKVVPTISMPASFLCCERLLAPVALDARVIDPAGTTVQLTWAMQIPATDDVSRVIEYEVQESAVGDFSVVDQHWETSERSLDLPVNSPGRHSYRVRATSGRASSAWSDVIVLLLREVESTVEQSDAKDAVAHEVHLALMRLCAAHGELFAVLGIPRDMTEPDAVNYVEAVTVGEGKPTGWNVDAEGRNGSFAALYHPWLDTRDITGHVQALPPDGAVLGMIAARALDRGAWVAPANRALLGLVGLHTVLSDKCQAALMDRGVNLVLQRPQGFTLLSEETLSRVPEFQPIHVRRLLILLRRMIGRLGEEFTFETNNQILRDLVKQRCINLLDRLFRAGAFAGRIAAEGFQVSVDDVDNTTSSIDVGRLIVRVRIRPAQALRSITIRFALGGGATGISEESTA